MAKTLISKGDRVKHDYLGAATVVQCLQSSVDRNYISGYIIKTDAVPPFNYNMGDRMCLAFPENLVKADAK